MNNTQDKEICHHTGNMELFSIIMPMTRGFIKKINGLSADSLLRCLDKLKAWMALGFLHFNEQKTEVTVFGGFSETTTMDLGSLTQFVKPIITNLGVKMENIHQCKWRY